MTLPTLDEFKRILENADQATLERMADLLTPKTIPFAPQVPTARQQVFLDKRDTLEVLYGGAAGGGKSSALLLAASEYVDNPHYHAILFRRTYTDLTLTESLISRSMEWWKDKGPIWRDKTKTWKFPSGATISFGFMEHEQDKYRYNSAAYQGIFFDELTHFTESQYTYMFSRLRKNNDGQADLPLRMRAGSNPGGVGHDWVKKRFLEGNFDPAVRAFVPARLHDNPFLDHEAYIKSLDNLDPITRAQLLAGDWNAFEGGRFHREWFRHVYRKAPLSYFLQHPGMPDQEVPRRHCVHFTVCDPAARTEEINDPTAIVACAVTPQKQLLVLDVVVQKIPMEDILPTVASVAMRNDSDYVALEDVAFQWALVKLGKKTIGMPPVKAINPGGKGKLARATMAIVAAERGDIYLPDFAAWKENYIAEHVPFTGDEKMDAHDDMVDCTSYAFQQAHFMPSIQVDNRTEEDKLPMHQPRRIHSWGKSAQSRRGLFGKRT